MKPKPSVQTLTPYDPEVKDAAIKLDANESTTPLIANLTDNLPSTFFRYPDHNASALREKAADYYDVDVASIIAGNGSSEMIELILKTYLDYGDTVTGFEPSFSMYRIFSEIYAADYLAVKTDDPFLADPEAIIAVANRKNAKVIFLCTPNNPTGTILERDAIIRIHENTNALIVVDEAYIEFYDTTVSMSDVIHKYPRLIVLRTLSKAFGIAGVRLGFLIADTPIVDTLNKVRAPYNLNTLTQAVGIRALSQKDAISGHLKRIKKARTDLSEALSAMGALVFDSRANFIFFRSDVTNLYERLLDRGILIRRFKGDLASYYRVTIGTDEENRRFIRSMKEVTDHEKNNPQPQNQ